MGTQAAMTIELWGCITNLREHQVQLFKSAKQTRSSAKGDPDALETLELSILGYSDGSKASRAFIDQEIVQCIEDSLCLSAAMFSRVTLHRRKRTTKGLTGRKGARNKVGTE